jgi:hypothetical protein
MLMKRGLMICVVFLVVIFSLTIVSAHQPRLVYDKDLSLNNSELIQNPEISQAYYGELNGSNEYYKIVSNHSFDLYVQILSPYIENASKNFIVEIYYNNATNASWILNGVYSSWIKFHEPFANDDYWQGPSLNQTAAAGTYLIKVSNINNKGKYVLVFGTIETFPFKEMIRATLVMPRLKMYFGKSVFTAYFNKIGIYLGISLGILIAIIVVIVVLIHHRKGREDILDIKFKGKENIDGIENY